MRLLARLRTCHRSRLPAEPLDARSDVFSFGVVLLRAAGRDAGRFAGATDLEVLQAIIHGEPPKPLGDDLPPGAADGRGQGPGKGPRRIAIRRCATLVVDLRRVARQKIETATVPVADRARVRWLPWVAAAVLAGAGLIAVGMVWARRGAAPLAEGAAQFTLSLAEMPAGNQPIGMLRPSPDGQLFVFAAGVPDGRPSLSIRSLDSLQISELPGTEGVDGAVIWSPDGRWVGYYADGKLPENQPCRRPSSDDRGPARIPGRQPGAHRGDILYRPTNRAPIFHVSESGGPSRQVTELNQVSDRKLTPGSEFSPGRTPVSFHESVRTT